MSSRTGPQSKLPTLEHLHLQNPTVAQEFFKLLLGACNKNLLPPKPSQSNHDLPKPNASIAPSKSHQRPNHVRNPSSKKLAVAKPKQRPLADRITKLPPKVSSAAIRHIKHHLPLPNHFHKHCSKATKAPPSIKKNKTSSNTPTPTPLPTSRRFDPDSHDGGYELNDPTTGFIRLSTDPSSIIIGIHGASPNSPSPNGRASPFPSTPNPKAAYGVFISDFVPGRNKSGLVPITGAGTGWDGGVQAAHLYAMTAALASVDALIAVGHRFRHVVLKTDSKYVEEGLCDIVGAWRRKGFVRSENGEVREVRNAGLFRGVDGKMRGLEEGGVRVSVRLVEGGENCGARRLVGEVLKGEGIWQGWADDLL